MKKINTDNESGFPIAHSLKNCNVSIIEGFNKPTLCLQIGLDLCLLSNICRF